MLHPSWVHGRVQLGRTAGLSTGMHLSEPICAFASAMGAEMGAGHGDPSCTDVDLTPVYGCIDGADRCISSRLGCIRGQASAGRPREGRQTACKHGQATLEATL